MLRNFADFLGRVLGWFVLFACIVASLYLGVEAYDQPRPRLSFAHLEEPTNGRRPTTE